MDVGFYVSELLELHGDVSVPGLGHLVRARISGYYNEADQALNPPRYEIQFEPDLTDGDDRLIKHIADKKNISLESSEYFIEKYVANLKQEALNNDVPVAGVGVFYTKDDQLSFKRADNITTDKAFYGLPPIKINKINREPVPETVDVPEVLEPEQHAPVIEEEETVYDDEPTGNGTRKWLIAAGVIIVLALAVLALQRYNPSTFDKLLAREAKPKSTIDPLTPPPTTKTDTAAKLTDSSKVDTLTAKNKSINNRVIIPAVTNKLAPGSTRVEIIIEAFKNMQKANTAVDRYKSKGVNAYIVPDAPGKRIMISAGAYNNRDSAKVAMNALIAAKKIYKDSYPLEIKQK